MSTSTITIGHHEFKIKRDYKGEDYVEIHKEFGKSLTIKSLKSFRASEITIRIGITVFVLKASATINGRLHVRFLNDSGSAFSDDLYEALYFMRLHEPKIVKLLNYKG